MLCGEKLAVFCENLMKRKHILCAEYGFLSVKILEVHISKYWISEGQTFRFDQKENGHWVNVHKHTSQKGYKIQLLIYM